MKITNKFNVPATLMALAQRDFYTKGKADYSVTEIISPPRIQRLRKKHWEELETDVADMLWMMLGTALHVVAERSQVEKHTNEERIIVGIDGVLLSGAIDLQQEDDDGVIIYDYKFTSAWAIMNDKPEWEQQQNVYKYLIERAKKKPVKSLKICALIRDWSRRDAQNKANYPQAPIQVIDIPMWELERTEAFIRARIESHKESKLADDWDEELPLCSEEDRWVRETTYAVKKEGRKTAVRVFDSELEAQDFIKEMPEKTFIEIRRGESVRCTGNFCGVNQFCSQYQKGLNEGL